MYVNQALDSAIKSLKYFYFELYSKQNCQSTSDAPEPRLGSVLARAFKKKARLGSACSIFQKARFLKLTENEPISHFYSIQNLNI